MIVSTVLQNWINAAQTRFGANATILQGTIAQATAQTARWIIAISVDQFANHRAQEPMGDSPLAPGDYSVAIRIETGVGKGEATEAYDLIEEVYMWSQSQERRHHALYYHTAITPVVFTDAGDLMIGTWIVTCRVRSTRG